MAGTPTTELTDCEKKQLAVIEALFLLVSFLGGPTIKPQIDAIKSKYGIS